MPHLKMGRVRHSESVNLLWAVRALSFPPLLVSSRLGSLSAGSRGSLTAACTLIGAGAVMALLVLKYNSHLLFSSRFTSTVNASSVLSFEEGSKKQDKAELTVPGLQNAGNNCFLNVILQALASSEIFVSFMTACSEVTSKEEMMALVSCKKEPVAMPLAVSVSSLMKELSQLGEGDRSSSPRLVMHALTSYVKKFDLASQQDAAEALVHLASAIQEECDNYLQSLKPTFQSFATASLILDQGLVNAGKSMRGGDQLLQSLRGLLHWPLEGTLASSLTCQRCAYQYTTQIRLFNDISLSPSLDQEGNIMQGCTLENCLEQFTGPEWVDSVKCSSCSHEAAVFSICSIFRDYRSRTSKGIQSEEYAKMLQSKVKIMEECSCDDYCQCEGLTKQQGGVWTDVRANASKQLKIGRSPEVVCFQLQRLVMGKDGALKKLTGHVSFPKVLDLFPFTIAAESSPKMRDNATTETKELKTLKQQRILSLKEQSSQGAGQTAWLETGLVCDEGTNVGLEERTETADILYLPPGDPVPFEICSADLIESPKSQNWGSTDAVNTTVIEELQDKPRLNKQVVPHPRIPVLRDSVVGDSQHEPNMASKFEDVPCEESTSISPLLSASSGTVSTYSPFISSMCLPYIPRVLPSQLQPFSLLTPYNEQRFSIPTRGRLGNMSPLDSAPKSPNKSISRRFKYSRRLLYQLVSVVVHQGGPQSGHYIVYRKMTRLNTNKIPVFKKADLVGKPADEQTVNDSGEQCTSSMSFGDQAFPVQQGTDVSKSQTSAWDLPSTNAINKMCDGGRTDPFEQLQGLKEQELNGCLLEKAYTNSTSERSVEEKSEDRPGGLKDGLDNLGRREMLLALWFRVSDTHVQRVPEQEVFNSQASLLFYEQLGDW